MNQASFFIEKKALFGGYPNHCQILELQREGVKWFIDLTHNNEKNIRVYSNLVDNWINFPIKDGFIPTDKKKFTIFLILIQMVLESLKPGEKLYLHCRGGHGRSSLVIACFLGYSLNLPPLESLELTRYIHSTRPNLRKRWLERCPLNLKQKLFVENFFGKFYMYSGYRYSKNTTINKNGFFRYIVALNFYLYQNPIILDTLLNSGMKKIMGEDVTSQILQELRFILFYNKAKKLFDFG
jgi:protein-tyrosine phosphatase